MNRCPYAGLTMDFAGNLYGTTEGGGKFEKGAIFEVNPSGQETILYSFGSVINIGDLPTFGVTLDPAGNLYGTASPVIYRPDIAGNYRVLYRFLFGTTGGGSLAPVTFDAAGNIYGTTLGVEKEGFHSRLIFDTLRLNAAVTS